MKTTKVPCPALKYRDKKYWCGLITNTNEYVFPQLGLTTEQYASIRDHILTVNNFGEGCDFERWQVGGRDDMPLMSKYRARKAVPISDCSGRKMSKDEREDVARYILEGAEIERDMTIYG